MIATRLSSVWQVAGVAVAALCCYLVSQSVASERAALGRVDRQIAGEQDVIGKLTTEIATRSRLTQIESWNRQLALQAPRPGQYMDSGVQLASLYAQDAHPQLPLDPAIVPPHGPVEQVTYRARAPLPAPAVPLPAAKAPPVVLPDPMPTGMHPRGGIEQVAFHAAPAAVAPKKDKPRHAPVADASRADAPEPSQPLLRTAAFVRPKISRLDDGEGAVERVAYHAPPAALLSADIASLAKAERAKAGRKDAK